MIDKYFKFYEMNRTNKKEPHLAFKEDENTVCDVICNFRPLFFAMKFRFKLISDDDLLSLYTHSVCKALKRYDNKRSLVTFGSYLKTIFHQQCITKMKSLNADKRKANLTKHYIDNVPNDTDTESYSTIKKNNFSHYVDLFNSTKDSERDRESLCYYQSIINTI